MREAFRWVKRMSRLLKNKEGLSAKSLRGQWVQFLARMRTAAATTTFPAVQGGIAALPEGEQELPAGAVSVL